jgi:hypothetical protein
MRIMFLDKVRTCFYQTLYDNIHEYMGARGSVVGWGTMLQAGRSPVRVSDEVEFFNLHNPSSFTVALGVDSASYKNEYQEFSWG